MGSLFPNMKLVPYISSIFILSSSSLAKPKPGFLPNLLEKGWEANKQAISDAIDNSDNIGDLIKGMAQIDVKTIEKPAHDLMQKGMDIVGEFYKQNERKFQREVNAILSEVTGVDSEKLAKKLISHYNIDPSAVEDTVAQLMKDLLPTLTLKLLRNSYEYLNIDDTGAVVPADIETRLMGLYLEYFCAAEKIYLDDQKMQELRGDPTDKTLSADLVKTWAESLTPGSCSAIYSTLAHHNWHLVVDAAGQSIKEVDIDWDDEFNYDEFKLFQYANELNMAVGGTGGNQAGGLVNSNYCSAPYCYPSNFEDSFCSTFNERNRNFSATASDSLRVIMVVDQSGSMSSLQKPTIDSFNWFLGQQRKLVLKNEKQPPQFTLSKFNSQQKVDSWNNIKQAHRLNRVSYWPSGSTRLYDSLECLYRQFGHEQNNILMIITDGYDNMSSLRSEDVKKSLEKLIEEKNWVANYIGANHDATSVGTSLGVPKENCVDYEF